MDIITKKDSEKLQKTTIPSLQSTTRQWYFLDLKDKIVGKLAPKIAEIIRGKNKKDFLPNLDLGSYVVLTNAKYIKFTGNKLDREYYYNHSGYPGGLRERSTRIMSEKYPKELVFRIIKGMVPHTKLGRRQLKRLFVYTEDKHNLQAQEKQFIKINL